MKYELWSAPGVARAVRTSVSLLLGLIASIVDDVAFIHECHGITVGLSETPDRVGKLVQSPVAIWRRGGPMLVRWRRHSAISPSQPRLTCSIGVHSSKGGSICHGRVGGGISVSLWYPARSTCRLGRPRSSSPGGGGFPHRGVWDPKACAGPWRGQKSILQKG